MLQKRTNILFDKKTWQVLQLLAKQQEVSAGELVRKAVKNSYFSKGEIIRKKEIFKEIIALRKKVRAKLDYRQLIEDGRKY